MNKFLGVALLALGAAIAIVPSFTDSGSHGVFMVMDGMNSPLAGDFAARAEIAVGVPLAAIGAFMTITHRREGFLALSVLGILLSGFAIALPTGLIGTESDPMAISNTLMKPAVMALGSLAMAGSLGGLLLARKASS